MKTKTGWVLGKATAGSARIGGHNLINGINARGNMSAEVIGYRDLPPTLYNALQYDTIVFQKAFLSNFQELANDLVSRGRKVVFSICDYALGEKSVDDAIVDMANVANVSIATSQALADVVANRSTSVIKYISDALESTPRILEFSDSTDKIKVVGVTSHHFDMKDEMLELPAGKYLIEVVGHKDVKFVQLGESGSTDMENYYQTLCRYPNMSLVEIGSHGNNYGNILWSLDRVEDDLASGDVGIIPVHKEIESRLYKGHNRATLMMSLGLPVVATDIDCYKEIINHGENGFLVSDDSQWVECLDELRVNPDLRKKFGIAGRDLVRSEFSLDKICSRYEGELKW